MIYPSHSAHRLEVQLAGKKNPFTVIVILACVQLISVILLCTTTDQFGRRPLTVYGYMITVVAVLCLGIVGYFGYRSSSLGSLLVRYPPTILSLLLLLPLLLLLFLLLPLTSADTRVNIVWSPPFRHSQRTT